MHRLAPPTRQVPAALLCAALAAVLLAVLAPVALRGPNAAAAPAFTYVNGGPNYQVARSADPNGDDYPAKLKSDPKDADIDPWRFYNRECTSFVAWRLNEQLGATNYPDGPWKFSDYMTAKGVPGFGSGAVKFGNAGTWDAAAEKLGYTVNAVPAIGAVAQWHGGETSYNWSGSSAGHVGIVVAVASDGTITMASYNASVRGGYDLVANIKAPRYLHIADLNADPRIPAFVDAAYTDFLHRPPTSAEMKLVSAALTNRSATYSGIARMLANSDEWVTDLVTSFYNDQLGRQPDPAGLAYWTKQIQGGMSVARAAASIYGSAEYYQGAGGTPAGYVSALYQAILQRSPDASGLAYWTDQLAAIGTVRVAEQLYQSQESRYRRVATLYEKLLGRAPDAGGQAYWAARILTNGDLSLASYLAGSAEYLARAQTRFPDP